jgi:nucleoside-diphosphate-sugar epimerase
MIGVCVAGATGWVGRPLVEAVTSADDLVHKTPPTPGKPHNEPMVNPLSMGLDAPDGAYYPMHTTEAASDSAADEE